MKDEYIYDAVRGTKKPALAKLNKTKLTKLELDDMFNDWENGERRNN